MSLSFLGSFGMLAVVAFRSPVRAGLGKALLQALLFSLCLVGVFGVLLPVVLWTGSSDLKSSLFLALIPFAIVCPAAGSGLFLVPVLWALYLGLMTVSLWRVGKITGKARRVIGRTAIIVAFGAVYAIGWYLTAQAMAAAAIAVMMQ